MSREYFDLIGIRVSSEEEAAVKADAIEYAGFPATSEIFRWCTYEGSK